MTWVKICGITNLEDARTAVEAGADALGFVFAASPRRVNIATVQAIGPFVPAHVEKVGVFVDESADTILDVVTEAGLTAVQLHGSETSEYARGLRDRLSRLSSPVKLVRAVRAGIFDGSAAESLGWDPVGAGIVELDAHSGEPRPGPFAALLVDSGSQWQHGGTGSTFDWHRATTKLALMGAHTKLIVAGGLTPANVDAAIRIFHPWGVDVATGVESEPGKKDPGKMARFIEAAKAAEQRL